MYRVFSKAKVILLSLSGLETSARYFRIIRDIIQSAPLSVFTCPASSHLFPTHSNQVPPSRPLWGTHNRCSGLSPEHGRNGLPSSQSCKSRSETRDRPQKGIYFSNLKFQLFSICVCGFTKLYITGLEQGSY